MFQVRDLLLWQDVYMGDAGNSAASQLVKDVITSQSQEGSDNGQESSEESDKLQVSLLQDDWCLHGHGSVLTIDLPLLTYF